MVKKLQEIINDVLGHQIHYDISINKLKQLADRNASGLSRYVVTNDNKLIGADATQFTHHDMDPNMNARVIGYIKSKEGSHYYTAYKNHSSKRVAATYHPMLQRFEDRGIPPLNLPKAALLNDPNK